ncbi:MAG: hypothetical protein AB7P02_13420 [Alphaproteobacteria bacterium]
MNWLCARACALVAAVGLFLGGQTAAGQDAGWPRELKSGGNVLRYYQPQVDSWEDQRTLVARVAVNVVPAGETAPVAGAVWLRAATRVNLERREVVLENIETTRTNFSIVDQERRRKIAEIVQALVPREPMTISLDRLLADAAEAQKPPAEVAVRNDPPPIIVSRADARLVLFDGEPVFAPIEGTGLTYVVNTNWSLFRETASGRHFLLDGKTWLTSADITGPWSIASALPGDFLRLPPGDNWRDARAALPARATPGTRAPTIYVATTPSELIVVRGQPTFAAVQGTQLQVVTNTGADLFFHRAQGRYYFLVAGRWYRSASLDGPWTFATADLPPDFLRFPSNHPKARIRASVPGTPESKEAIMVASIPSRATISRSQAKLSVTYTGTPAFVAINGTALHYSPNASTTVIRVSDTLFYACERGVWFVAPSVGGPWTVADSVPAVIYTIPPSSPVYNVTYVRVESATTSDVVVSFTAGYMFGFVTAGVLAWGTGYYYPPYWVAGPLYPIYHPYPYTWGAAAWYNPVTNTYFRGGAVYGPYGGIGAGAVYNPATGAYGRGYAAYGPHGGYAVGTAYNPSTGRWVQGAAGYGPNGAWRAGRGYNPQTGVFAAGVSGTNQYGSWGRGVVTRGDDWARGGYVSNDRRSAAGVVTSEGTGVVRTEGPRGSTTVVRGPNDTFVGRDGEVYRRSQGDGWQRYENGSWNNARRPDQLPAQARTPANGNRPHAPSATQGRVPQGGDRGTGQPMAQPRGPQAGGVQGSRPGDFDRGNLRPANQNVFEGLSRDSRARDTGARRQMQHSGGRQSGGRFQR